MAVHLLRRRFTVHEYHRMGQAGILGEDERPELLAGAIVKMAPIGSRRQATVDRFNRLFSIRVIDRAIVSIHGPVRLAEHSEPQPDLMLLRRRADFYASAHPGPDDVLQLVEVSDTSTQYDREVKLPLYRHSRGCWRFQPGVGGAGPTLLGPAQQIRKIPATAIAHTGIHAGSTVGNPSSPLTNQ